MDTTPSAKSIDESSNNGVSSLHCLPDQEAPGFGLFQANELVQAVIDALSKSQQTSEFVPIVLQIVSRAFGCAGAGYFEFEPDETIRLRYFLIQDELLSAEQILTSRYLSPSVTTERLIRGFKVSDSHLGVNNPSPTWATVVDHSKRTINPEFDDWTRLQQMEMEINAPLVLDGKAFGAVTFFREARRPYTQTEIGLAETLTKLLALTARGSSVEEQAKERDIALAVAEKERCAAEHRANELARANEVLRRGISSLVDATDVEVPLREVVKAATEIVGARGGALGVFLPQERGFRTRFRIVDGILVESDLISYNSRLYSLQEPAIALAFEEFARGNTVLRCNLDSPYLTEDSKAILASSGLPSSVLIGLMRGSDCIGYLGLSSTQESLSDASSELLRALGHQMSFILTISRIAHFAEDAAALVQERNAELVIANEAMIATTVTLGQQTTLEEFVGAVLESLATRLSALGAEVWLYQQTANRIDLYRAWYDGLITKEPPFPSTYSFSAVETATIIEGRYRFESNFLEIVQALSSEALLWYTNKGVQAVLRVPLRVGEAVIGNIAVWKADRLPYAGAQIETALALSHQAALAIHAERLSQEARSVAVTRERERATKERIAELTQANDALRRAISGLASIDSIDDFVAEMVRVSIDIAGAHTGALVLLRDQFADHVVLIVNGRRVLREEQERDGTYRAFVNHRLASAMEHLIETGDLWAPAPDDDLHPPAFQDFHRKVGNKSIRLAALVANKRLIGWLGLGFAEEEPPTVQRLQLLRTLAEQITVAVEFSRLAESARETAVTQEKEKATQQRAAELAKANEVLRRTNQGLLQAGSPDAILPLILKEAATVTGAVDGIIERLDPETNLLHLVAALFEGDLSPNLPGHPFGDVDHPAPLSEFPIWPSLVASNDPFFLKIEESELATGSLDWHRQRHHTFVAICALVAGGEPLGILGLAFRDRPELTGTELEMFKALGQQATLALQLSRLSERAKQAAVAQEQEQAAQHRAAELARANEVLRRTSASLLQKPDLNSFATCLLVECCAQLEADAGHLTVYHEKPRRLTTLALIQDGVQVKEPFPSEIELKGENFFDLLVAFGRPRVFDFATEKDLFYPGTFEYHQGRGHTYTYGVPLLIGTEPLGHIGIATRQKTPLVEKQLELLGALAQQASLAIQLNRLADTSRKTAEWMATARERSRVASEIHDGVQQNLTAAHLQIRLARRQANESGFTSESLERAEAAAVAALHETRRAVQALRPPAFEAQHSLISALRNLCNQTESEGLRCRVLLEDEVPLLSEATEVHLFRIAQEGISNAIKHAGAEQIVIRIGLQGSALHMSVEDDGCGFDPETVDGSGHGLSSIKSRAHQIGGEIQIKSYCPGGTTITVRAPVAESSSLRPESGHLNHILLELSNGFDRN